MNTLVAILGRLGSEYPGEIISAAFHATKLLKTEGETWETVLQPRVAHHQPTPAPPMWRSDLDLCQRRMSFTTGWEKAFIADISRLPTLSSKQRVVLSEIAAKLRKRGLL